MDPIEELITNLTKEGKSAGDIAKAVQEKIKSLAPPPETKPDPKPDPKPDLNDKVESERKDKASKAAEQANLEAALRFNLTSDKFIKDNKAILPKDIEAIFAAAEKEKYDSVVEKANVTKSAVIKSFFSLQANLDLLTASNKGIVEDYFKLSSKGREEKADEVYRSVFEPALETLRLVKRAEEVGKGKGNGEANEDDAEKIYREKLIAGSKKHFFGEK